MATTVPGSPSARGDPPSAPRRVRIAIIGGGFTGLGMGIRFRQAGIEDFEILERSSDIGGTWRDNSYPGCAVDVQSHLYSYSFAPNPSWGRVYSPQEEIWAYIRRCADEFGVSAHVRLGHEVLGADWDDARQRWMIDTSAGPLEAQFLISAMGPLSQQSLPAISGHRCVRGGVFSLRGVGPRPPPRRRARRRDRHRRVRRAAHPRDPAPMSLGCWSSSARRRGRFRG